MKGQPTIKFRRTTHHQVREVRYLKNMQRSTPLFIQKDIPMEYWMFQYKRPSSLIYISFLSGHKDCKHCGKVFLGKHAAAMFRRHLKVHMPKKQWICGFCKRQYDFKSRFKAHELSCRAKQKTENTQKKPILYH